MEPAHSLTGTFWGRALVAPEWRRLCFVAYDVEPALLAAELPPSLSLDLWRGRAIVSLTFWETRFTKPFGHVPSEPLVSTEIALRYYVHEGARRGTVTLLEHSSSPVAAVVARALFREPMRRAASSLRCYADDESVRCQYELAGNGRVQGLRVRAPAASALPEPGTLERFLVQRPYGYARSAQGGLLRYDLDHPPWQVHPVLEYDLDYDFGALYGPTWAGLSDATPLAVVMADGSKVRISLPE